MSAKLTISSDKISGHASWFSAGLLFWSLASGGFAEWRAVLFKFERESRGVFETFQANTGVSGGKMREIGEVFLNPDIEFLYACDADVQQEIGIARERIAGNDLRNCAHAVTKFLLRFVDVTAEPDIDEDVKVDAKLLRVQQRDIALNDAGVFQTLYTSCAGCHG